MNEGPTHVGVSDPIFALERYLQSDQKVDGAKILFATRTIGLMRFIAFEV
jgi:hypothetical protein